jgi:RNA polymerase sigma factor (sigma-70 family)
VEVPDSGDDFSKVFDCYAPAILRYACRRVPGEAAAWDVVSDTFTAAWRHWNRRPRQEELLLPWLYAIARNAIRGQGRSAQRRRQLVARLAVSLPSGHASDPADGVVLSRSLADALRRLSEADREVLRLVAWEGQTDARALGLALGLSPVAARSRLHRARRRLRAVLDETEGADASAQIPAATICPQAKEA